jgi:RNA polymerase sigma-70 factor (ECF subfamily)
MSADHAKKFEAVYSAQFHDIALYVARRVRSDEVEDVVAKVFLVAWRRFENMPAPPQDRLWLFGVARRCVANHQRSGTRADRLQSKLAREEWFARHSQASQDHRIDLVVVAMQNLKSLDREALQLVLWDELTHAEAASVLGCSENAFEIRYRRARKSVRDAVEVLLDSASPSIPLASDEIPLARKGVQP